MCPLKILHDIYYTLNTTCAKIKYDIRRVILKGKKRVPLQLTFPENRMRTFNMSTALPTVTNINVMVFCLINIF